MPGKRRQVDVNWSEIEELCYRGRHGRASADEIARCELAYKADPERYGRLAQAGRDRADCDMNPLKKRREDAPT